ncbi:MAG: ATPase domain-containing protein [Candidatus Micrarchaeia archaeon]
MELVKTGIKGLDELLGGGIPKGFIINVTGPIGSGKTIFAAQFVYNGLKNGEGALYISFAEKKRNFYKNFVKFGWDFNYYEKNRKFVFLEFPISEISNFRAQENSIFNLIINLGIERIVLDPITPLALIYENEAKRFQELLNIVNMLRGFGATTIIVSEPEEIRRIGLVPLVDGVIELRREKRKGYRIRTIEILKMHGVEHSEKICPFKIGKSGMVVYPNQYLYD